MSLNRTLSTAPMMDWSDRHCRYFWRMLTKNTLLYTEMVTGAALTHAKNIERFLDFSAEEHPVALQVGGSDTTELSHAAKLANQWNYDELNLNVGCPSDRVQNGMIGAILMLHPEKVADAFKAMSDIANMPVTVKHRIGIDQQDSYSFARDFVGQIHDAGCRVFIVHTRSAILKGLSPKENREIPPLKHDYAYQLKKDFPDCEIIINGGIKTLDESLAHLDHVDGVMLGREAYQNPMVLSQADSKIFNQVDPYSDAVDFLNATLPYIEQQVSEGVSAKYMLKHLLGIIQGVPNAKAFRRFLSENMHKESVTEQLLSQAINQYLVPSAA